MTHTSHLTFLGIGAQKAGTTWLHRMLALHPDIGMPEQKELHFWDRETPSSAGIAVYLARFAGLKGHARGEITPSYAMLPPGRIALIKVHLPGLRFLYVLRNPIDRAWSQARMEMARELHHGSVIPESSWPEWLTKQMGSAESIARGDYAACLANWFEHYPRDRFLVSLHEENRATPRRFLMDCAQHLGVDADFYQELVDSTLGSQVLPETEILKIKPLPLPSTPPSVYVRRLLEIYTPLVRDTEELLGRPLATLWLDPYRQAG